jgi:tetratricopeptide (TPR) repeat protein
LRNSLVVLGLAVLVSGCAATAPTPPLSATPGNSVAAYLSASYAARQQDTLRAARYFSQSLTGDPNNPELLAESFFYSMVAGDIGTAQALATRIAPGTPDYRVSRLLLAAAALKKRDYVEARKELALSAKDPSVLSVSLIDAWAAAGAGDDAGAADDMKRMASQSGLETLVAYHKALLAEYERKPVEAEAAYRLGIKGENSSPRIIEAYGRFLERQGRAGDARELYNRYLNNAAIAPVAQAGLDRITADTRPEPMVATPQEGAAEVLFGIAAALTEANNAEISILYLRLTLYLRPDLALADILLADRLEGLHRYGEAIAAYHQNGKSSPYYRMAAVQAAIDESHDQNEDGAIADLESLAAQAPHDTEVLMALGDAYRAAQKPESALDAYNRASATLPAPVQKDWALYYARAAAEDGLHRHDAAEADLKEALKLSPNEPEVMNFLGYSWVDQGRNFPEALVMLEKARALRPLDGYITDSVGWAYYRLGRYQEAAKTLENAVLLVPGDTTIYDHFGDALWRTGQHSDARFQWDHALTFGADADEKKAIEQKLKTGLSDDKPG